MSARLPSVAAARLLVVLCATAGCAAAQQQQPSAESRRVIPVSRYIDRYLEQKVWPDLLRRLELRMESLDGAINKTASQQTQIVELVAKYSSTKSQLESLTTLLGSQETQVTRLVTQLDSQQSQLSVLTDTSISEQSRLDGAINKTASQQSQLAVLTDTSSSEQSRLDGAINKTASQQTQIDTLAVRLDQVEGEVGPGGSEPLPRDCSELPAGAHSGIHMLQPGGLDRSLPPVEGYCDEDADGVKWTVIQRRDDTKPHQDFYLGWPEYKKGFGNLTGEFWLGLDNMWRMTSVQGRVYELRINLEDFDGEKAHAVYQGFRISSEEDGYRFFCGKLHRRCRRRSQPQRQQ